jgi:hypothetical protein
MDNLRRAVPTVADETGSALILALVFIISVGLLVGVLINLVETNLLATSTLSQQRALQEAADGALETAVQTIRYPTMPYPFTGECPTTPVVQFSPTDLKTDFGYTGGSDLSVWCSDGVLVGERQVTFCAGPSSMGACTASPSAGELARAQVLYGDVAPSCAATCSAPGASVTIESWSVDAASH